MPVAADGGVSFTFNIVRVDGGSFSQARVRHDGCSGGFGSLPLGTVIVSGASSRTYGVEVTGEPGPDRRVVVSATPGPALQRAERFFLWAPATLQTHVAVLPMWTVGLDGGAQFRDYTVVDGTTWAGSLQTTEPSSHIVRMTANRAVMMTGVYDLALGTRLASAGDLVPLGLTRVFEDRAMFFGVATTTLPATDGVVRFQIVQVTPTVVGFSARRDYSLAGALAPFGNAGEIASEFTRSFPSTSTAVWFLTVGTNGTLYGRFTLFLSGQTEFYAANPAIAASPVPFQNQMALTLDQSRVMLVSDGTQALVPLPSDPMGIMNEFPPSPLAGPGPAHVVHVSNAGTRVASLRPSIQTAGVPRRNLEFISFDQNDPDAGVLFAQTFPVDLALNNGTRAISDPSLGKGCVVNDRSSGVHIYYSVRSPGTSTYQHYVRRYFAGTAMLGAEQVIELPGSEDAVISCGPEYFHSVDMWHR